MTEVPIYPGFRHDNVLVLGMKPLVSILGSSPGLTSWFHPPAHLGIPARLALERVARLESTPWKSCSILSLVLRSKSQT